MQYLNPASLANTSSSGVLHYLNPGVVRPDNGAAEAARRALRARVRRADIRAALLLTVVLLALGAVLGFLWSAISPPGPLAVVWNSKHQLVIDENETFIATDARFAIIALITGVVAGLAAWFVKPLRSVYTTAALAVGGVGGAYLTSVVGYYVRGTVNIDKPVGTLIRHAPLGVHIRGFFLLEAAAALLVFLLFVAFADRDDLGRGH